MKHFPRWIQEAIFKIASVTGETNQEVIERLLIVGIEKAYPNSVNIPK